MYPRLSRPVLGLLLIAIATTSAVCADGLPDIQNLRSLEVAPARIHIRGDNRRQQLLVTARDSAGRLYDVTHLAEYQPADAATVQVQDGRVRGLAEGVTEIHVRWETLTQRVKVEVQGVETYPPVHFRNDVAPLLSKLGCNSGGCHGKQGGQNGFHLSVFGFDSRGDYDAIVKQSRGRRVFPAGPANSLILAKASGLAPHGGGRRLDLDSPDAQLLTAWVAQGTPWGDDEAASVERIEIFPENRRIALHGRQQILVTAVYSDGTRRDVTSAAAYSSNAEQVAKVEPGGRAFTGNVPGEAAITVNFMGKVGAARLIVPRTAPEDGVTWEDPLPIDDLVQQRLKSLGLSASPRCDDATFLRRLHLDVLGVLPPGEVVRAFLNDSRPDKRQRMIDSVLDQDEYADYWALRWADILLVDQRMLGERGAYEFHRWLRAQMAANRPYDQWVRELLTASGNSGKHGPVNFYRALRTPEDLTRSVSQVFLGVRLDCAQCHHHPFDRWGQDDFYGLAGFFTNVQRKPLGATRELVFHAGHQPAKVPQQNQHAATRPPGAKAPTDADLDGDPRNYLARWMTAADNPWFARLVANRLWKHFLGRGLVEPEDDLRSTNPATNEPLLAHLASRVTHHQFDLKAVMREILNSRVYQLSSRPTKHNHDDQQNYSHFLVKRLPAEVMLDAISRVTGVAESFPGSPRGTRAVQLWDNRLPSYFLDTFGRSERQSPCECGKSGEPTMAQALHLMNSAEVQLKISHPQGRVAQLLAREADSREIVEEICYEALSRPPGDKERQIARRLFAASDERQAAEDFLWTILNAYDFLFIQ